MSGSSKPEQIIDTYVTLLVDVGVRQATIEAVARACGLSKAGLLHHYRSRTELDAGLISRLRELVQHDLGVMRTHPDGPVRYYLSSSLDSVSPLERIVVAATRLGQAGNADARGSLRSAREAWFEVLEDALGNPVLAKLALLAGDGMSFHADIAEPGDAPFATALDVEHIARIIER